MLPSEFMPAQFSSPQLAQSNFSAGVITFFKNLAFSNTLGFAPL
jgi:hypothetical protein